MMLIPVSKGVIMVTEEQIKKLAHEIWEKEGRPEGKHMEHYIRAKQIMEEKEASRVIELAPPPPIVELPLSSPTVLLGQSQSSKSGKHTSFKKK